MTDIDKEYLKSLVVLRDDAANMQSPDFMKGYFRGRIEEYCAQNAIVQAMYPDLHLRLGDDD